MSAPIRHSNHVLGDIGETESIRLLQKYGWTADKIASDYGEDISSTIFIDGKKTNLYFRCQIKSTHQGKGAVTKLKKGGYSVSVSSTNVSAWLQSFFPVILIVYDESVDKLFYESSLKFILKNPSKLKNKSVKIRVPSENELNYESKNKIYNLISKFYEKLFRLEESKFKCKFYPVIMPHYRVIPYFDSEFPLNRSAELEVIFEPIDELPLWMEILNKIDPTPLLKGYQFSTQADDLGKFIKKLHEIVNVKYKKIQKGEWLAFVFSPIQAEPSDSSEWNKELTYWQTYSLIENNLVSDYDRAFGTQNRFLNQLQRRSRSWEYFHKIDPLLDNAVQFFANHKITPSVIKTQGSHYQSILAQFVLWKCPANEIAKLSEKLIACELKTLIVDDSNSNSILLAIVTPFFTPSLGLYSVPRDWSEYDNGIVRNRLEANNLLEELPGSEYTGELPSVVNETLSGFKIDKKHAVMITEKDYDVPIPLIQTERVIWISKFLIVESIDEKNVINKINLIKKYHEDSYLEIFCGIVFDEFEKVVEIRIEMTPYLSESSLQAYEKFKKSLKDIFDSIILDSKCLKVKKKMSTYDILSTFGEIEFENLNK